MLAFSNDYYGIIFRATQSVELFCAYQKITTNLTNPDLMSLLYHNDTIIKKEKELLRALLIQFCKLEFIVLFHSYQNSFLILFLLGE